MERVPRQPNSSNGDDPDETRAASPVDAATIAAVLLYFQSVQASGVVFVDENTRLRLRRNGIGAAGLRLALNALALEGRIRIEPRPGQITVRLLGSAA